ncbi:MAG: sulfotransferase [Isosphaeraceae bacterium]
MATLSIQRGEAAENSASWAESVRLFLFRTFFTNLCGISFFDWCRILRDNHFHVSPRFWHRASIVSIGSVLNSCYRRAEDRAYDALIEGVSIHPPLFILGHWRSGTTLLHNLLALDDQFSYPNLYEVFFPHTFLSTEGTRTGQIAPLIPRTRVFDNVAQGLDLPNEDEFATAVASLCSPYLMWAFPKNTVRYERYLTFRGVPADEVEGWKRAFVRFLKKLTLRSDRPLLLKSPPHTGRIKLLLDLFPDARFVHIHRDPYTVFRSTRHLNDVLTRSLQFHHPDPADLDDGVLRRYKAMHDAYFDERGMIPAAHLCELAFEDLEQNPVAQMRKVYENLGLLGFDDVRPAMEDHLSGLTDYRKNSYPRLSPALKARVLQECRRSFDAWGYSAD